MTQQLFSTKESHEVIVYTDGGSRGNPGPAALGVIIQFGGTKKIYGEKVGHATNNIAEYSAIVFALKKMKQLVGKKKAEELTVKMFMDSELAVRQLNGEYKIENEDLQPLWLRIWNLKIDFKKVIFAHVPREKNKEADRAVNRALDA
ncbi:MAG: ribonuclease HI family protein [bacterium]|nr:ribonuclease HI family protein [bacterium]